MAKKTSTKDIVIDTLNEEVQDETLTLQAIAPENGQEVANPMQGIKIVVVGNHGKEGYPNSCTLEEFKAAELEEGTNFVLFTAGIDVFNPENVAILAAKLSENENVGMLGIVPFGSRNALKFDSNGLANYPMVANLAMLRAAHAKEIANHFDTASLQKVTGVTGFFARASTLVLSMFKKHACYTNAATYMISEHLEAKKTKLPTMGSKSSCKTC